MYNRMSDVINKIERRLGTKPLGLPDNISKEHWANEVIIPDTLSTFSRFFPHMIEVAFTEEDKSRDGKYYLLDRHIPENYEVLGVGDILWDDITDSLLGINYGAGYGIYNILDRGMDMDSIMFAQQYSDISSLFNTNVYVKWIPPNKVKLEMALQANLENLLEHVKIGVFVKHPPNLMTIEPTKMETFEQLATADVATWLYNYLKHYDGIETVYATINLHLDSLQDYANRRQEIVDYMRDNYVNPANSNQPIMYTI